MKNILENEKLMKLIISSAIGLVIGIAAKIPAKALTNLTNEHVIDPLTANLTDYIASKKN